MSELSCRCKAQCTSIAIVAAIIIGVITGMLTFMATITITPAFLWVLFGIAVVYLAVLLATSSPQSTTRCESCFCSTIKTLLFGILGTILISVILLGIEFAATSLIGAIFAGLLLAFYTLLTVSTVCLVLCKTNCND